MTVKIDTFDELLNFVNGSERYGFLSEDNYRHVLCRDCSTRTSGVAIPSDEIEQHEQWHAEEGR